MTWNEFGSGARFPAEMFSLFFNKKNQNDVFDGCNLLQGTSGHRQEAGPVLSHLVLLGQSLGAENW